MGNTIARKDKLDTNEKKNGNTNTVLLLAGRAAYYASASVGIVENVLHTTDCLFDTDAQPILVPRSFFPPHVWKT